MKKLKRFFEEYLSILIGLFLTFGIATFIKYLYI